MSKEFRCVKCNCFLGTMIQGKVHKKAIFLCTECHDAYKIYESLANHKKGTQENIEMPEFFKDIFDGKKK